MSRKPIAMGSRLFHVMTGLSLLLCFLSFGLWARSLGHFEEVRIRYNRWPQENEVHHYYAGFSWYSNSLRLRVAHLPLLPSYFHQHGDGVLDQTRQMEGYRRGWNLAFVDDNVTRAMNGYTPGFTFSRYSRGLGGMDYVGAVRAWLPVLVTAVLPTVWLARWRRLRHPSGVWRFSLRELIVVTTVLAAGLGVFLWLKN